MVLNMMNMEIGCAFGKGFMEFSNILRKILEVAYMPGSNKISNTALNIVSKLVNPRLLNRLKVSKIYVYCILANRSQALTNTLLHVLFYQTRLQLAFYMCMNYQKKYSILLTYTEHIFTMPFLMGWFVSMHFTLSGFIQVLFKSLSQKVTDLQQEPSKIIFLEKNKIDFTLKNRLQDKLSGDAIINSRTIEFICIGSQTRMLKKVNMTWKLQMHSNPSFLSCMRGINSLDPIINCGNSVQRQGYETSKAVQKHKKLIEATDQTTNHDKKQSSSHFTNYLDCLSVIIYTFKEQVSCFRANNKQRNKMPANLASNISRSSSDHIKYQKNTKKRLQGYKNHDISVHNYYDHEVVTCALDCTEAYKICEKIKLFGAVWHLIVLSDASPIYEMKYVHFRNNQHITRGCNLIACDVSSKESNHKHVYFNKQEIDKIDCVIRKNDRSLKYDDHRRDILEIKYNFRRIIAVVKRLRESERCHKKYLEIYQQYKVTTKHIMAISDRFLEYDNNHNIRFIQKEDQKEMFYITFVCNRKSMLLIVEVQNNDSHACEVDNIEINMHKRSTNRAVISVLIKSLVKEEQNRAINVIFIMITSRNLLLSCLHKIICNARNSYFDQKAAINCKNQLNSYKLFFRSFSSIRHRIDNLQATHRDTCPHNQITIYGYLHTHKTIRHFFTQILLPCQDFLLNTATAKNNIPIIRNATKVCLCNIKHRLKSYFHTKIPIAIFLPSKYRFFGRNIKHISILYLFLIETLQLHIKNICSKQVYNYHQTKTNFRLIQKTLCTKPLTPSRPFRCVNVFGSFYFSLSHVTHFFINSRYKIHDILKVKTVKSFHFSVFSYLLDQKNVLLDYFRRDLCIIFEFCSYRARLPSVAPPKTRLKRSKDAKTNLNLARKKQNVFFYSFTLYRFKSFIFSILMNLLAVTAINIITVKDKIKYCNRKIDTKQRSMMMSKINYKYNKKMYNMLTEIRDYSNQEYSEKIMNFIRETRQKNLGCGFGFAENKLEKESQTIVENLDNRMVKNCKENCKEFNENAAKIYIIKDEDMVKIREQLNKAYKDVCNSNAPKACKDCKIERGYNLCKSNKVIKKQQKLDFEANNIMKRGAISHSDESKCYQKECLNFNLINTVKDSRNEYDLLNSKNLERRLHDTKLEENRLGDIRSEDRRLGDTGLGKRRLGDTALQKRDIGDKRLGKRRLGDIRFERRRLYDPSLQKRDIVNTGLGDTRCTRHIKSNGEGDICDKGQGLYNSSTYILNSDKQCNNEFFNHKMTSNTVYRQDYNGKSYIVNNNFDTQSEYRKNYTHQSKVKNDSKMNNKYNKFTHYDINSIKEKTEENMRYKKIFERDKHKQEVKRIHKYKEMNVNHALNTSSSIKLTQNYNFYNNKTMTERNPSKNKYNEQKPMHFQATNLFDTNRKIYNNSFVQKNTCEHKSLCNDRYINYDNETSIGQKKHKLFSFYQQNKLNAFDSRINSSKSDYSEYSEYKLNIDDYIFDESLHSDVFDNKTYNIKINIIQQSLRFYSNGILQNHLFNSNNITSLCNFTPLSLIHAFVYLKRFIARSKNHNFGFHNFTKLFLTLATLSTKFLYDEYSNFEVMSQKVAMNVNEYEIIERHVLEVLNYNFYVNKEEIINEIEQHRFAKQKRIENNTFFNVKYTQGKKIIKLNE